VSKHRYRSPEVIETELREHPAVAAWNAVQSRNEEPSRIVALKDNQHSSVFRLEGIGPDASSSVIAKRSKLGGLLTEWAVYRQVLTRLPVTPLRAYEFLQNQDGTTGWLFLEDAGDERWSTDLVEHRALAGNWLGTVHASASALPDGCHLPDRGPAFFQGLLLSGSDRIRQSLDNPVLSWEHRDVLKAVLHHLEVLALHWDDVERSCERVPKTLVHGDLKSKNLRVRELGSTPVLFALDWEVAGWATPAVDLHFVDELELYLNAVRSTWPCLSIEDLWRLRNCGRLFRLAASVYWEAAGLEHDWLDRTMRRFALYSLRLNELILAAGWEA
jgi:hypothetical protein